MGVGGEVKVAEAIIFPLFMKEKNFLLRRHTDEGKP